MKDLSGDGKITKKDVLIGRGVLPKNAKNGGLTAGIKNIQGMKNGGHVKARGKGAATKGFNFKVN